MDGYELLSYGMQFANALSAMCFEVNLFNLTGCHMVLPNSWSGAHNMGGLSRRLQKLVIIRQLGIGCFALGSVELSFPIDEFWIIRIPVECGACLPCTNI